MSKQYYDESQIKKHPRRNRAQNKTVKNMIYHLDLMFGEENAGAFLAMICDGLDKMLNEVTPTTNLNLRTIEIKFNDCFSIKMDCDTGEYIDQEKNMNKVKEIEKALLDYTKQFVVIGTKSQSKSLIY